MLSPDGRTIARDVSVDFASPQNSHHLLAKRLPRCQRLLGTSLCIASAGTQSYYHWLLDELPRLLLPGLPDHDRVICSTASQCMREARQLPGLNAKPLAALDPDRMHVKSDLLLVPSYASGSGEPSALVVELLADAVRPLLRQPMKTPEKILISRSNAKGRRLNGEEALFTRLEPRGYTVVQLEKLSWQEQITLFHQAREIIAPHGAGLANLAFCSRKPLVIELFHPRYVHWCFWRLAELAGACYVPMALPAGEAVTHEPAAALRDIDPGENGGWISAIESILDR